MAMDQEPELAAMAKVLSALEPLDDGTRARVVGWIVGKLEIGGVTNLKSPKTSGTHEEQEPGGEGSEGSDDAQSVFSTFAELCAAASPSTDAQKALVAGYWFQVVQGADTFASQECNEQLKHFGTPIGNVTRAFDNLKNTKPQLAIQIQKSGKSKQARKKFKLTHAGIEEVKSMLSRY